MVVFDLHRLDVCGLVASDKVIKDFLETKGIGVPENNSRSRGSAMVTAFAQIN